MRERILRVLVWGACLIFCGAFWGLLIWLVVR